MKTAMALIGSLLLVSGTPAPVPAAQDLPQ